MTILHRLLINLQRERKPEKEINKAVCYGLFQAELERTYNREKV